MRIQYAHCVDAISENLPQTRGKIAPPAIAITNNADAVFVNLPKPSRAKGQIAGQTSAFAKPSKATNNTEIVAGENKTMTENTTPRIADN